MNRALSGIMHYFLIFSEVPIKLATFRNCEIVSTIGEFLSLFQLFAKNNKLIILMVIRILHFILLKYSSL